MNASRDCWYTYGKLCQAVTVYCLPDLRMLWLDPYRRDRECVLAVAPVKASGCPRTLCVLRIYLCVCVSVRWMQVTPNAGLFGFFWHVTDKQASSSKVKTGWKDLCNLHALKYADVLPHQFWRNHTSMEWLRWCLVLLTVLPVFSGLPLLRDCCDKLLPAPPNTLVCRPLIGTQT